MSAAETGLASPVLLGVALYLLALAAAIGIARQPRWLAPWLATLLLPPLLPANTLPATLEPYGPPLSPATVTTLVLLTFTVLYLPIRRLNPALDEVAVSLGVALPRRFGTLVWPVVGPGATLGLILAVGVPLWHTNLHQACWVGAGGVFALWLVAFLGLGAGTRKGP